MQKSKYQQKIRGIKLSNAPWGIALGSLPHSSVELRRTKKVVKLINLNAGFVSAFIKSQKQEDLTI
ncbi:MAG: hypothetical protein ACW98X_26010 [Promethearchaeota archaeon]|jgi:hypothetical protein